MIIATNNPIMTAPNTAGGKNSRTDGNSLRAIVIAGISDAMCTLCRFHQFLHCGIKVMLQTPS